MQDQILIYQKPVIVNCPDKWGTFTEEEKEDYCKTLLYANNRSEYDVYFPIKDNVKKSSLTELENMCQRIYPL